MPPPPSGDNNVYSGESSEGETSKSTTLIFENPDGSMHHALPTGIRYKRPSAETPPLDRQGLGLNDWVIWDPVLLQQIERLYARHERGFIVLLFLQFLLENSFNALIIKHRDDTTLEIRRAYPFLDDRASLMVFWVLMSFATAFAAVYYIMAVICVWERRSIYMKAFSDIAIFGIIGQIIFAYINRFNMILFFLRFTVFAHSRFLFAILNGSARIIIATNRNEPVLIDV